jgi:hypothetical protein
LTTIVAAIANLVSGASPLAIGKGFGNGFWTLIPFTMQMDMVAIVQGGADHGRRWDHLVLRVIRQEPPQPVLGGTERRKSLTTEFGGNFDVANFSAFSTR